jgi:L-arabinose isomerase
MAKIKIGILQLYLKLYDEVLPGLLPQLEPFTEAVRKKFEAEGFEAVLGPVCRVKADFENAVSGFENSGVDVIVSLHLAYSPSLEAIEALASTRLPLVIMDTTVKYDFSCGLTGDDIMRNHGIHGVQDLCNLLLRKGKPFLIEAGHWEKSDIVQRLAGRIKSAAIFRNLNNARTGIVGGPFYGMGDFFVPFNDLKEETGITAVEASPEEILKYMPAKGAAEIGLEESFDRENFSFEFKESSENIQAYNSSVRLGLAFRHWMEKERLGAFTVNFSGISAASGFPTIPFMEASKAMAFGKGYAGEGDVLTASLTGALMKVFPDTSFTEMFCPDWDKNLILLSHMGEINYRLASGKPRVIVKDLPFIDLGNPAVITGQFKAGPAVLVNLAPGKEGYNLIICPVQVEDIKNELRESITGWFRPSAGINDFLADFSRLGGSHHSVLVYGSGTGIIKDFGEIAGFKVFEF